ncbi:MAG: hypothetical protein H8D23_40535 [Candidatus Brocadiales bacterium]|nr:hypothetical protein [Candidatus Brocadiales bacterium]
MAKTNKLLWIGPIALLLIALLSLPYYYYQLMRWAICGCAAYLAYQHYKEKGCCFLTVAFIVIAIVYNPIEPIHLFREAWIVINIITVFVFLYGWVQTKKNK